MFCPSDQPSIWVDGKGCPNVPVVPPLRYFEGVQFLPDNPLAWYAGIMVKRVLRLKPEFKSLFENRAAKLGVSLPWQIKGKGDTEKKITFIQIFEGFLFV